MLTTEQLNILKIMPVKQIRCYYHIVQAQLKKAFEQGNESALQNLYEMEAGYLAELVKRGEQV